MVTNLAPRAGHGPDREATVVVIGAGQAGLAMSACLTRADVDHVLLERSSVASAWADDRWDSLRLLTPNWMTSLPGWAYDGDDPDGYATATEIAASLRGFATSIAAPAHTGVSVTAVVPVDGGFVVHTDRGPWRCRVVVDATGATGQPFVPAVAAAVPGAVHQLAPIAYRRPEQLADGHVLVVGASASGAQLADELARSGRRVTLAVGDHVRLPRTYRGMDVHWWLRAIGVLDRRFDQVPDIASVRRAPSLQLVGTPERRSLDLGTLAAIGVEVAGRLTAITGGQARFAGDLPDRVGRVDERLGGLLDRFDDHARREGLDSELELPDRPAPIRLPDGPRTVDLRDVRAIVWATGYRPSHPWLPAEVLDSRGAVRHAGGVAEVPGLYVLGQPFLRHRGSTSVGGVGRDAAELTAHLVGVLTARRGGLLR